MTDPAERLHKRGGDRPNKQRAVRARKGRKIEGENMRAVTWVVVEEVKSGDWGMGGQALTTDAVRSLAAGSPAA